MPQDRFVVITVFSAIELTSAAFLCVALLTCFFVIAFLLSFVAGAPALDCSFRRVSACCFYSRLLL